MCSTNTPGYAPTMSLTTQFPLLQRAGWSRAGSSAGGAGGTNQLYVFILRGGGIILENLANIQGCTGDLAVHSPRPIVMRVPSREAEKHPKPGWRNGRRASLRC